MSIAVLDRRSGLITTSSGVVNAEELQMGARTDQTASPGSTERELHLSRNLMGALCDAIGDGCEAPTPALIRAREFMAALPDWVRVPDVVVDDNGSAISFDWYSSNQMVLSVHVDSRGIVGFAAVVNGVSSSGSEPFVGAIPAQVSDLLGSYRE